MALALDWPPARAASALSSLCDRGYLARLEVTMDFSGLPRYAVADPEHTWCDVAIPESFLGLAWPAAVSSRGTGGDLQS